jgi:UDP-N-acetylglucosamine 1-carboxyvinyltransferase
MDKISIKGGVPLKGTIPISGAKNAALPLMAASILSEEPLTLENLPDLADTALMAQILENHGVTIEPARSPAGRTIKLSAARIGNFLAPYDLVRKMRASFLVLGPLLARFGEATVSLPGGCAIGTRPVDMHLKALEALGAELTLESGYVHAKAPRGLTGGLVHFPFVSVGATEHVLMAAALAKGETLIENAAMEPEIGDLAHCLLVMGAQIEGIGTRQLKVQGVQRLHGATHRVLPDRIEAGTFAMAVGAAGGAVTLEGMRPGLLDSVFGVLRVAGIEVEEREGAVHIARGEIRHRPVDVTTEPFPGFPTDLQAQFMALMATASGPSRIIETIFENRFMHVPELARMGAEIEIQGHTAHIRGVDRLKGAPVMATDLRASVGLVLAGLAAEGETTLSRVYHLDRGFERLEEKLSACGARIERLKE